MTVDLRDSDPQALTDVPFHGMQYPPLGSSEISILHRSSATSLFSSLQLDFHILL
jgi:hypothetical protein